jgi:hypothetical protein
MKEWNRSACIGLAKVGCLYCHGNGTRLIRNDKEVPCNCTFRAIFRACLTRYRECAARQHSINTVQLQQSSGNSHPKRTYSFTRGDYMADFEIIARRTLTSPGEWQDVRHRAYSPIDWDVFKLHFLWGADWRLCCQILKIDRGVVFHSIYRVEQNLGRAYGETQPYALWPLGEYFGGTVRMRNLPMPAPEVAPVRELYAAAG